MAVDESSKNEVLVYPNFANENLIVQLPSSSNLGEAILNLYSMDGKQMGTYLFEGNSSEMDFSVAHLGKGMYILEIINDSKSVYKKFIKN